MDPRILHGHAGGQQGQQTKPPRRGRPCSFAYLSAVLIAAWLVFAQASSAPAQLSPGSPETPEEIHQRELDVQQQLAARPRATVTGVVKNAASGEPLPRALVRIEGDATSGALTDGDGRFEIPNVPIGPQAFQVIKPGFRDVIALPGMIEKVVSLQRSLSEHNVLVAAGMPELTFTLAPSNSIRGQIVLSTGEPAQGLGVMLLRRAVQDGRAVWQAATNARTNSDGAFRFAGLSDGLYAVYTEPAMDSDSIPNMVAPGSDSQVTRNGYGSMFYPDARDLAGAGKIELSGGQEAQANLSLTLEAFHMVRATVLIAGGGRASAKGLADMSYTGVVMDAQGHQLPYTTQYDAATRTMQAMLPDGTYSMLVTAVGAGGTPIEGPARVALVKGTGGGPMLGQTEFSVAGHAVANLRIPLGGQQSSPIHISVIHSGTQEPAVNPGQAETVFITLSQAGGWITDGMVSTFAEGTLSGGLETTFMAPGSYWVHTNMAQRGLCQASFTAGGASLAREPLTLGLSGATAPMTLSLRDDCAALKLSLPGAVGTPYFGEEPYYTVYVVPDFDSTADVTPFTLRPSTGGTLTVDNLTPGAYHIYVFPAPVELEYRNPSVLAALPSQTVTLAPSATSSLMVEVPGH